MHNIITKGFITKKLCDPQSILMQFLSIHKASLIPYQWELKYLNHLKFFMKP